MHRIPPQPEDRIPGTLPTELQEQSDDSENQDLFVPADGQLQGHHSPSQIVEWRRQEQEQWNREVLARSTLATSGQPLSAANNLNEPPRRSVPGTSNNVIPARSRNGGERSQPPLALRET